MDFNDTPQEAEFRAKCRAWLEANAELKTKKTNSAKNINVGNKSLLEAAAEWQKKKYDAGWAMIHWPKEVGGIGATPIEGLSGHKRSQSLMFLKAFMRSVLVWLVL